MSDEGHRDRPAGKSGAGAVFLFDTTHDAMRAEEAIIEGGFWCDVIPRPPDTAATLCGLAVEVQGPDCEDVAVLLKEEGISYEIYEPVGP